ncbi:MAG TPA: protein kinase [Bryobacteraceae bacterium]|nr:protein kinase [Bryobacteraceae bacterium]
MAPAEWDQVLELFHAAREKSGGERVLLLQEACGGKPDLRKAVEELLKEDEAASGFLSEPLFASFARERCSTRINAGQKFGRYTTVAVIGRGGMGEVWSAYDADLDRTVALKFLSSEALLALDANQITREAKAASALNHPGIVTIHEVVQSESTLAIAMELVQGKPLRELCGKPVPIPEVAAIGHQIAEALAAAHAQGTIHGDIKPENILLRPDRYVKVLDFGLARKVTTQAIAFGGISALGTLRYMSPEQARGDPLTPASDVFSFGLVLYELTTGRHAFQRTSPADTARAILSEEAPAPCSVNPSLPSRLNSLIRAMLAKDPAARPSALEVGRILYALQNGGKASFRSPSAIWTWAAVALLLAAGIFVIWRWEQMRDVVEPAPFRQITRLPLRDRATAAAISPDGKHAAYANASGIFVRNLQNGETKTLSAPSDYVVDQLAWFAGGAKLVASGYSATTLVPSIWLILANGAPPRLLRANARAAAPSPNGKWIAFVTQDWSEVWAIGTNGEQPRRMVAGPAGDTFPLVFWSPDGQRINFQRNHPADSGTPAIQAADSVLFPSAKIVSSVLNIRMSSASALPDGHILFLQSGPLGSSSPDQLWDVKTDRATGRFLGAPRRIGALPDQGEKRMTGMTATPDGKRILVLRGSHDGAVYVGDFKEFPPLLSHLRRLTLDQTTNFPHAWMPDGRAVIFESNRNGRFDLYKQNVDQKTPETIVSMPPLTEMLAQMSPDRRWLLYATRDDQGGLRDFKLMRVPVEGGTPEEVPIGGPLEEFRCALDPGTRCVLRTTLQGQYYVYYDLDPIRGKGRELARTKWTPGWLGNWDISPDGTRIALPDHDSNDARIRVIDLASHPNEPPEHEVVLPIPNELRGLVWAAGGHGWFVSVKTTTGYRMLYVYLDGHFRPLGDIQGWAVPSPDGQRVAVWDHIAATNAWLVQRH